MDLGERLARRVLGTEERHLGLPVGREQAHELAPGIAGGPEHRDAGLLLMVHKYAQNG